MTSKIINMAERMKDEADAKLTAMFESSPVADDGFSTRVMSEVRRRMWVRRLSLPIALAIGLAISAKPLAQLVGIVPGLLSSVFGRTINLEAFAFADTRQMAIMLFGGTLAMVLVIASRVLEE